jgi:hypothetical protein
MRSLVGTEELANYHTLVGRIDELCAAISGEFAGKISCRAGCSSCCRELTLFPVEAAALLLALSQLPPDRAAHLDGTDTTSADGSCPLLVNGLCLVYTDRPVICRTHGLPLLYREAESVRVDFCPENFQGVTSLPGSMAINLELLNQALVAVNEHFIKNSLPGFLKDGQRRSISEIITFWKGLNNDTARFHSGRQ